MGPKTMRSYYLRSYGFPCKMDKHRKAEKRGGGREIGRESMLAICRR